MCMYMWVHHFTVCVFACEEEQSEKDRHTKRKKELNVVKNDIKRQKERAK